MPENIHVDDEPTPESDEVHKRETDRAPPWDCDAPTRSDRGSARTLPTLQAVDTTGDDEGAVVGEAHLALAPPPIAADLAAPTRALCDLTDDFESADTV